MPLSIYSTQPTPRTPFISFNPSTGAFEINGKSIPENPGGFYRPLIDWIGNYIETPAAVTTLNIRLEYFNTSSSKFIVDILRKLDSIKKEGKGDVVINWLYEKYDDDMAETGDDFKNIVKSATFNLVSFEDKN
jgi:hypothetical protein